MTPILATPLSFMDFDPIAVSPTEKDDDSVRKFTNQKERDIFTKMTRSKRVYWP